MTADDFFSEEKTNTNSETTEQPKIKVGEKEYTQDELQGKIGLADKVSEFEGKWNTKIDKLMPAYTKVTQESGEKDKKIKEYESKMNQQVENKLNKAGLTEEQKVEARKQLSELLGDEPLTKKEFEQTVNIRILDILAAQDLIESVDDIVAEAKTSGKPATTRDELITFMRENGERNPEWAYKKMFEKDLKTWEQQQLKKARPSVFSTIERTSTTKEPPAQPKPTKENMSNLIKEIFARE